jgi:hypothetical protein
MQLQAVGADALKANWDFDMTEALGLMRQTAPFLLFRIVVYFGVTVALIVTTGFGAGLGWGIGAFGDDEFQAGAVFWGSFAGFGLTAGVVFFLRNYLLYLVKAGHIAVMIELMEDRVIPGGQDQVRYAWKIVGERFGQASSLFGLDQLIKGILGVITGLIEGILSLFPIPGVEQAAGVLRAFLKIAVGLVDEVILGHLMRIHSENPWRDSQDALVLYAQNAKPMMVNAAWLTLFTWVLSFVVFLVMLAPAAFVVWILPGTWSAGGLVFAVVFAWAVKSALIEPFAIACMLQVFFKVTAGQQPDAEWRAKLDGATDKFRALGQRAAVWSGARPDGWLSRLNGGKV